MTGIFAYLLYINYVFTLLERQIVCAPFSALLLCRRERHGGRWSLRKWRICSCRLSRLLSLNGAIDGPGIDTVEPTSLIFAGINIERHGQFFSTLYVELLNTIFTKNAEAHFSWILVVSLQYILL